MTVHGGHGLELTGSGAGEPAGDDPRWVGGYPILGRLGAGGMGRVHLALRPDGGGYAAVKQIYPHLSEDPGFLRRFGHELQNLAGLPDGVSTPLLASGSDDRPPWFATTYVPGVTLNQALDLADGPLPPASVWLLVREAATALARVHAADLVHRDLKPSNVMLRGEGVTLIDFGLARALGQSKITQSSAVIGTPPYMSPEQAAGREVTAASDVFSLASLVCYAATGKPPFGESGSVETLYRVVHTDPDLDGLRGVDGDLADLVGRCLARSPGDRPSAAEIVLDTLDRVPVHVDPWPAAVTAKLAERAAFAAAVPDISAIPDDADVATEAGSAERGRPADKSTHRRRRALLAPLIFVLAAGTGLTIALTPWEKSPAGQPRAGATSEANPGHGAGTASPTASTASPSASASKKAKKKSEGTKPSKSAKAKAEAGKDGKNGADGRDGKDAQAPRGTSGGTKQSSGSSSSTSHSGSHSGSSSGSRSSGSSSSKPSASGTHRLRNAGTGTCLAANGQPGMAPCSSVNTQDWTYAGSGGSFELKENAINGMTMCLEGAKSNVAVVYSCGQPYEHWQWSSAGAGGYTLRNTSTGQCLDAASTYSVQSAPCDAGKGSQIWRND